MPLPTDRTTANTAAEHVSDHNTANGLLNGLSGTPVVRAVPFTSDTPNLLTGVVAYTPTPGDLLLDAWVQITTAWDGTTPKWNIGTFLDGFGDGLIAGGRTLATASTDNGEDNGGMPDGLLKPASRAYPEATFTTTNPLKVCVSQDGSNIGADPGSTQGAAILYLVTATPA